MTRAHEKVLPAELVGASSKVGACASSAQVRTFSTGCGFFRGIQKMVGFLLVSH